MLGELEFGAEKSTQGDRNRARPATLAQRLPLVGIDYDTTRHYAQVRALLERQGTPIGANDTWIAAQALTINATLVRTRHHPKAHWSSSSSLRPQH